MFLRLFQHPKQVCLVLSILVLALIILHMQSQNTSKQINTAEMIVNDQKDPNKTSEGEKINSDRRVNGTWFNFSTATFRLYAYSALYDDRPSLLSLPVIRITAVSDHYEELKKRNVVHLHCVLHHDNKITIVAMKEEPKPIGYGWPLNKRSAREYIYTCPTLEGIVSTSVSITTNKTETFSEGVPVTFPDKPETKRNFCVCVQAAYGTLDPYRIIEWLELQKILGVSLVGVYILSAPENVLKVFKHYSDEKFVDLRKIDYIYSDKNDKDKEFWLHLTPAINDCIYRHMYEFKRMLVMDFDEFVMPRKHRNLSELVNYLDKAFRESKSPPANFAFRNNYFFLDSKMIETNFSKYLTFLKFRTKVAVSDEGYSTKSIINPQACVHMHNHYCWGVTKNYSLSGHTGSVDPEIALMQHYKKCHFSHEQCADMMKTVKQDDVMLRFEEVLSRNVKEKVKQIMGHDI